MGTFVAKRDDLTRKWFVIDADGQPLGRVAVEAAKLLRGKHKPIFTPNVDCGDHVIIVNAAKAVLTGNSKAGEPIYHHSGYPGGLKSVDRGEMLEKTPVKSDDEGREGNAPAQQARRCYASRSCGFTPDRITLRKPSSLYEVLRVELAHLFNLRRKV